jgi:predicted nucleic acid-binding protein
MMNAVSDSGPLHYLILIDCISILPEMFERVVISQAVFEELRHERTPHPVSDWIGSPPGWLEVASVETSPTPKGLGKGEWEAITLARSSSEDIILLMDDHGGRTCAEQVGLRVVGTLGLLIRASQSDLLDLRESIEQLLQTNFRAHPRLIRSLLKEI